MKKTICALALLAALAPAAQAASSGGDSTATFLKVEQGGRAVGMGGAYTAVADEASAMWWNPAGLARASMREVSIAHTKFVESMGTQYASVLWPLSKEAGTVGASLTYLSIPGIDGFDDTGRPAGKITANGYAASLAYARALAEYFTVGANAKILGQKLATEQGTGFAVDAGLQFRHSGVGVGVAVQNMGPDLSIGAGKSPLPLNVRAGISYVPHPKVTVALDEEKARDGDYRLHLGTEWKVSSAFALRGGFQQLPFLGSGAGYSMGVGYQTAMGNKGGWAGEETPWWERKMEEADLEQQPERPQGSYLLYFDYAFLSYGELADTHRFTLGLRF